MCVKLYSNILELNKNREVFKSRKTENKIEAYGRGVSIFRPEGL